MEDIGKAIAIMIFSGITILILGIAFLLIKIVINSFKDKGFRTLFFFLMSIFFIILFFVKICK